MYEGSTQPSRTKLSVVALAKVDTAEGWFSVFSFFGLGFVQEGFEV